MSHIQLSPKTPVMPESNDQGQYPDAPIQRRRHVSRINGNGEGNGDVRRNLALEFDKVEVREETPERLQNQVGDEMLEQSLSLVRQRLDFSQ